jgi:hypothetical protein
MAGYPGWGFTAKEVLMVMGERIKPVAAARAADSKEGPSGGDAASTPSRQVDGAAVAPRDDEPDETSREIVESADRATATGRLGAATSDVGRQ